jgi:hypothetical protein
MDRLDVARRVRGIVEGPAQIADAARDRGLADDGIAPRRGEELVLRDQVLRAFDQMAEDGEGLRQSGARFRAAPAVCGSMWTAGTSPGASVAWQGPRPS